MFNKDLKIAQNQYGFYDLKLNNRDFVQTSGANAISTGLILSLLTHTNEIGSMPIYKDFGCGLTELIKANHTKYAKTMLEEYIKHTIKKMKRISSINKLEVEENDYGYNVNLNISVTDDVKEKVLNYNFKILNE